MLENSISSIEAKGNFRLWHYLLHSLIIILVFTYDISVWGFASYDKYLYRIDVFNFRKKALSFRFLKEVTFVVRLLEISHKQVDLFPPYETRLVRNRGHPYIYSPGLETNVSNIAL